MGVLILRILSFLTIIIFTISCKTEHFKVIKCDSNCKYSYQLRLDSIPDFFTFSFAHCVTSNQLNKIIFWDCSYPELNQWNFTTHNQIQLYETQLCLELESTSETHKESLFLSPCDEENSNQKIELNEFGEIVNKDLNLILDHNLLWVDNQLKTNHAQFSAIPQKNQE